MEKRIKYIISSQHPDDWESGIFEDHSFDNKDDAIKFFTENYINASDYDLPMAGNWFLICVEEYNPAVLIEPEGLAEKLSEDLEIGEFMVEDFGIIAQKHFENMKAELMGKNYSVYEAYPTIDKSIVLQHYEE